jgi:hypothetical protein
VLSPSSSSVQQSSLALNPGVGLSLVEIKLQLDIKLTEEVFLFEVKLLLQCV